MRKRAIRKYITDFGGDGNIVVLLHGFLASSKYWTRLQPMLTARGFRVIAIDLLGFGYAPKPVDSEYTYHDHILHVRHALEVLHINTPVTLIGHSMGALIASRFATLYPERIESLLLLHPPLYTDILDAQSTLRATGRFYRFLLDSRYRNIAWVMLRTLLRYQLGKHTRHSREKSMRNIIEVTEIFGELKETEIDTLLFVGKKDRPRYRENLRSALLSDSVVVVERNVAHHSPVVNPAEVHEVVKEFLGNVPKPLYE